MCVRHLHFFPHYGTRRDSFGSTSDTVFTITLEVDRIVWAGRPYLPYHKTKSVCAHGHLCMSMRRRP